MYTYIYIYIQLQNWHSKKYIHLYIYIYTYVFPITCCLLPIAYCLLLQRQQDNADAAEGKRAEWKAAAAADSGSETLDRKKADIFKQKK